MIQATFASICGHVCTCACLFAFGGANIEVDLQISNFQRRRLCGRNRLNSVKLCSCWYEFVCERRVDSQMLVFVLAVVGTL